MKKKKQNKLIRLFLIISIIVSPFMISLPVKAVEGDTSGQVSKPSSGCNGTDSCWITLTAPGYSNELYGIRATVVDGNGTMVSTKSIDYIGGSQSIANYINNDKSYQRCKNAIRNKLGYLNGEASCKDKNWQSHDGSRIAKYLYWLPDIYKTSTAADDIKATIIGMNKDTLKAMLLNDLGYDVNQNWKNIENHYLIIEPVTLVEIGNTKYYGTYYELAPKLLETKWIRTVGTITLPNSIYSVGNDNIGGPGGYKNETYFNGKIKIAKDEYTYIHSYKENRPRIAVDTKYINDQSYGYGLGIYWIDDLMPETCDYNNADHFESNNSGPNGENCCTYIKDNLTKYGISEAEFYTKYPQCHEKLNSCKFNLTTQYPSCNVNSVGNIADITDWECIYASAYSNDTSIKNYFLKYGKPTDSCSVYCRNEVNYMYPSSGMITLAGNYFTIGNATNSYSTYLDTDTSTIKVRAATLGPVQISVTKQCAILGDKNNSSCKNALTNELKDINAPTVEFAYSSKYYNNPVETLSSTNTNDSSVNGDIHTKTVTYKYELPNSTYKYVAKNSGVSYKNASSLGETPYIKIGNHLPIHFSEQNGTLDYQLTIKNFNLTNFDNLILKGQTMSTNFETSIETYIKTLIDAGITRPIYINDKYYFNQTFTTLLNQNNFSINALLTSTCGNTSNYTCYNDANGVYCYDEGKTTNSEETYVLFNSCINSEVQKIRTEKVSYKNDLLYQCTFKVENNPDHQKGINIIFRPISLNDPFPSIDGDGRETGQNWCYGDDCSNTNQLVTKVITNNRNVETENVYKEREPLYEITLTPALIKQIRKYNKKNKYDDFNLECNSKGNKCKSKFLREKINTYYDFSKHFSGCGIKNSDTYGIASSSSKCANNEAW